MKFNKFLITMLGILMIGISIGYVVGFYLQTFLKYDYWLYLSVIFMGIGTFFSIYGSMFYREK